MTTTATRRPSSQARDPQSVELGYRSPVEYGALSSDGQTVYSVHCAQGTWLCQCRGFHYRGACCHVAAVAERLQALTHGSPCGNCLLYGTDQDCRCQRRAA